MKLRIVSRVVVYNEEENKIILVRNKGQKYWYPAGGGWEFENEKIEKGAEREVLEEIGLRIEVKKILYVREFQESENQKYLEIFWIAKYNKKENGPIDFFHKDKGDNGQVEEIKEFSKKELQKEKVFPEELKGKFWDNLEGLGESENVFLEK